MPELTIAAAVAIFIATYTVVAVGKLPLYRIDRAGAALLGGSLMLGTGVLTPEEAYGASYFKIEAPLTLLTILIALLWL